MSDTPRTDAMHGHPRIAHVPVHFAHELERELNAAKADLSQRTAEVAKANAERDEAWLTSATLRADLARATAERDEARRSACTFKARYMDSRIGFSPMTDDEANTEARKIAARMRWDCFKQEAKP